MRKFTRGGLLAVLDIYNATDELFDEESGIQEQLEETEKGPGRKRVAVVSEALHGDRGGRGIVWSREVDGVLDEIGPLWDLAVEPLCRLMQADGEGFYEGEELILELE